jgi:ParB family chromosome partitioning protein
LYRDAKRNRDKSRWEETTVPTLNTKPLLWFKTNPQVRKTFDEAELRLLGESLRHKQLQPVLAKPDGTIIAGERRFRAAKLVGLKELMVIVTDEPLTEAEVRAIQLTENVHRADLTGHEKWQACKELLELNQGWQGKDLAEHLHLDPSSVTRLLSPSKCSPAWQDSLRDGKVGISDCYAASKLQESEQGGLLALKLSGGSRDALEQAGRKKRAGSAPAVRASKIKIMLTSGVTVTVAGDDLSLDDAIEAVNEVHKEMRKGRDQGLDAKTLQAVCRDKAKAG